MNQYVGITDFRSADEARRMLKVFQFHCPKSDLEAGCRLMVGVMTGLSVITGAPTRWAGIWPNRQMMGEIFLDHPQVFNVLHYVDYGRQIQSSCLAAAALYGGEHLHAIQLEMIWPSPAMIAEFLQEYPGIEVILQVNAQALKDVGNDPAGLVQRLRRYQRLVSVILLDKDMGREEGVDAEGLVPFTRAVASSGLGFNLAVVSGLNPGAHRFIEPLMREFPSMSLEAFCDLKPNRDPAQPTSWNEADVYMIKALRMLQRIHRT